MLFHENPGRADIILRACYHVILYKSIFLSETIKECEERDK